MLIKERLLNGIASPEALLERLGLVMSATAPKNTGGGKAPKKPLKKAAKPQDNDEDEDEDGADDEEDSDEEDEDEEDEDSETELERKKRIKAQKDNKKLRAKLREKDEKEAEEEAERERKAGDHQKTIDRQAKQIETLTKERDDAVSALSSRVIDDGLSAALDAVGVNPKLKKGAVSVIRAEHEVEMEDGEATIDGEALEKFIKRWAKSETGKAYIRMKSSGGGAGGSGDDGDEDGDNKGEVNPWKKETWNMTQQGVIVRADAKKAERMRKEAGLVAK